MATFEEFKGISVSAGATVCLAVSCLLLLAVPVVFWLVWKRSHKERAKFRYLFAGAIGFTVSARVLELGLHMFCIVGDNPVSRFINGSNAAYVLYGILTAGVFEECGRYIVLKNIMKKDRTRENAVMYGIGHGGIEVLTVTLPVYILYLTVAVMFSRGDVGSALKALKISDETAAAALPVVRSAVSFGVADGALCVLERVMCMFVHIGLTVIVFRGVMSGKRRYLLLSVCLHMAVDIFAALFQRGLVSVWACELWMLVWTVAIVLTARKCYRIFGKEMPVR